MPRKIVPISSEHPYSISARCINKEWFQIPMTEVWEVMENYLYFTHFAFGFKIKAFVLMNNHFHLLVQGPNNNLASGMNYFMRETSRIIGKKAGRINQIYGGRYYRSLITNDHYYSHAYKYIYRNPVEAGLSLSPFDYKFSTLPGLIGKDILHIPVDYDHILFDNFEKTVSWLNASPSIENYHSIKNAMKRSEFRLTRNLGTNRKNTLEEGLY